MKMINLTKTVPTSDPVRDLLLKAARVMEARGWFRGWYVSEGGRVCMIGALRVAVTGDAENEPAWRDPKYDVYRQAESQIDRAVNPGLAALDDDRVTVTQWSDTCGGTGAAVAKLRKAAELAP